MPLCAKILDVYRDKYVQYLISELHINQITKDLSSRYRWIVQRKYVIDWNGVMKGAYEFKLDKARAEQQWNKYNKICKAIKLSMGSCGGKSKEV